MCSTYCSYNAFIIINAHAQIHQAENIKFDGEKI